MGIGFARGRARSGFAIGLAAATALTMALTIDDAAATGIDHGDVVNAVPRTNTPEFLDDEVRGHVQVGNRIIVGGGYTQVRDDTFGVVDQPHLAAYDIATGRLDMAFRPDVSGPVYSLADAGDGTIIAVGKFTSVNGVSRKRVVKLNVVDGSVVTAFKANANAVVNDVAVAGNRVYFGGGFSSVNGTAREKLAAVSLDTGAVASNFDFPVTEETGYWIDEGAGIRAGAVRGLDVTPNGDTLLVVHNSHRVGGQVRQSVALIDIDGTPSLLPWKTDNYDYDCQPWFDSFIRPLMRDAQFSPDGSYFVAVSSLGNFAPGCDVAVRFPTAGGNGVTPTWVSRLFDTPEAVAVTDEAIYLGGHMRWFQAPGTVWTDWGNGNTNTQPANTVARDQIGAINPANGTALPWDPGASGQRGVLALEATPVGLLAGSDGERFGGRQTYRHALFELPSTTPPSDTTAPNGTVTAPANGQVYNGLVTVTGSATDNKGVAEVYVVVKNTGNNRYLQPDLTWASTWAQLPSFVHEYEATSTSFGWAGDLPNGNYTVTARIEDIRGNVDVVPARSFVVTSGTDTVEPDGKLDVPTDGQAFSSSSVAMSGSATDNVAVAEVNLIIKDQETGNYLQDNGTSWGPWNAVPTSMDSPNTPATDWDWSGTLPQSNFEVWVQVKDLAGNKDPAKASATFLVDTTAPNATITNPKKDQTLTSRNVTFNGTATDNLGVRFVRLIIKDVNTGLYLQPNGSWGPKVKLPRVTLDDPGGTNTTWTFTRTLPKDGNFKVLAHTKDLAGNTDPTKANKRFSVDTT
jgi:hypothetical protein